MAGRSVTVTDAQPVYEGGVVQRAVVLEFDGSARFQVAIPEDGNRAGGFHFLRQMAGFHLEAIASEPMEPLEVGLGVLCDHLRGQRVRAEVEGGRLVATQPGV